MAVTTRQMILDNVGPALARFDIDTPRRVAAFLGQCAHESAMFTARRENLNYGWQALMRVWPKHFPSAGVAKQYERRPVAVANRAYRSRMGNGDEASGDPARWIGRSFIQISGRNNYTAFALAMSMPLDDVPTYLETDEGAFMGAGWFWHVNRLNDLADQWRITDTSTKINGKNPAHGLAERIKFSNVLLKALEGLGGER